MRPYYEHGGITIYHGDCREIIRTLPKVDLVITDPPYAIGASRGEWSVTASVAIGLHEASRRADSLIVFTASSGRGIEFTQGAINKRLPFNRLLIWEKVNGHSRAISPWNWDTVAILLFGKAPTQKSGMSSVFYTPVKYQKETIHPAELPAGLSEWLYLPFDSSDCITLDPFMGTGKLLDAPYSRGRRAIGIEIEERYCEIAAKRLSQEVFEFEEPQTAPEQLALV
jgi:DNA modification methylase